MKKLICTSILLILLGSALMAESQFRDYILTEKNIWALTNSGEIKLFDITTGATSKVQLSKLPEIVLLTKDKKDHPVIVTKNKEIKWFNERDSSWIELVKYEDYLLGVVFDSKNTCYLITNSGIRTAMSRNIYFSNKSLNSQIINIRKWSEPNCYYMDRQDNIWIGYAYGEWGGNLFVFNTHKKKFMTPILDSFEIELWPVVSFFEDSTNVYLTSGLQHFLTSGAIVRFDNFEAKVLLNSTSKRLELPQGDSMTTGEYIGPSTYCYANNSIYYYSQNGIFKGDKLKDLSDLSNWELVYQPRLQWKSGQSNAVGSPMNLLKLSVLKNDKIIFLSQNDGIGFYDGYKFELIN